jgi:hypothetical protein
MAAPLHLEFQGKKGLNKCTTNGFVGSLFSDGFLGYLYIKKIVQSTFSGWCLKYFRSKCTDFRIPGLEGEPLFLYLEFFSFLMQALFHMNSYVFFIANFVWLVTYEFVVLNSYS